MIVGEQSFGIGLLGLVGILLLVFLGHGVRSDATHPLDALDNVACDHLVVLDSIIGQPENFA